MWPCYEMDICMCMACLVCVLISQWMIHVLNHPYMGQISFRNMFMETHYNTLLMNVDNDNIYKHNCLKHDPRVCVCVLALTACTAWSSSLLSVVTVLLHQGHTQCLISHHQSQQCYCSWWHQLYSVCAAVSDSSLRNMASSKTRHSAGGAIYWHKLIRIYI